MAERSNAAVLKTVDGQLSGGSNPSLSANSAVVGFAYNGTIFWREMRDLRGGKKTCFRRSAGSTADLTAIDFCCQPCAPPKAQIPLSLPIVPL